MVFESTIFWSTPKPKEQLVLKGRLGLYHNFQFFDSVVLKQKINCLLDWFRLSVSIC